MLKSKFMPEKQIILRIEQYSHLLEVLNILKNENNTFPGMNNKFQEVLSPILRYYHAQNQGYVKIYDNSKNWAIIWPAGVLIHPEKRGQYISRNEKQIRRWINSNPEVISCLKPRLCQKNTQFLELSNNLTSWRSTTSWKTRIIHFRE